MIEAHLSLRKCFLCKHSEFPITEKKNEKEGENSKEVFNNEPLVHQDNS